MTRFTILIALLCSFYTVTNAQSVRRFHQSLSLAEASSLQIDTQNAATEVTKWSGSEILVEVTVTTNSGSTAILNHLQKEGRYDLAVTIDAGVAKVVRKQGTRQAIKVKGAEMDELVQYKISVPENFTIQGDSDINAFTKARK
jgi:ABC-type molybdate transport system substrate-binding protein